MSVLLGQAHGFEGLGELLLVVGHDLCDLARPQREDDGIAPGKLDAASLALAEHPEQGEDPVLAYRPHLQVLDPPTLPGVAPDTEPFTGPGVSSEDRERITERFYRAAGSEIGGFGLGLSIAAESVRAMGGTLELEAVDPHGTCVRVRLPLARLVSA